jgi:hypothetical protein
VLTLQIRNQSGGAIGAVTLGGFFRAATAASTTLFDGGATATSAPANNTMRSITFVYVNGPRWVELSRNATDVPF